jgi:hypothetical protein
MSLTGYREILKGLTYMETRIFLCCHKGENPHLIFGLSWARFLLRVSPDISDPTHAIKVKAVLVSCGQQFVQAKLPNNIKKYLLVSDIVTI